MLNGADSAAATSAAPRVGTGAGLEPVVVPSHWCSVDSPVKRNGRMSVVTGPSNSVLLAPSIRRSTVTGAASAAGAAASTARPAARPAIACTWR